MDQYSSSTCVFIGNEHGCVSWTTLPISKTITNSNIKTWDAHFGMITGLSLHTPVQDTNGLKNNVKHTRKSILNYLLLTISFDWKIKLWDISDISNTTNTGTNTVTNINKENSNNNNNNNIYY